MQNLKTQFLVKLMILLTILSFPALAGTNGNLQDNIQESSQQTQQKITQKIDQTENNVQEEAIKEFSLGTLRNLQVLVHNMQEKNAALIQFSKELAGLDETQAEEMSENIDELQAELEYLQLRIESVATGVAIDDYRDKTPKKFDLAEEIEKLLQPLIYSLKSVTQDSREIEELKQDLEQIKYRKRIAISATNNLNNLLHKAEDKAVKTKLEAILDTWQEEMKNVSNDSEIFSRQLDNKLQSKESIVTATGEMFADFFKNRGVSFIFGVSTFLAVFFFMRLVYFLVKKLLAKRKNRKQSTFERLTDLIYHVLTVLAAIMATLFIFNLRNDWLLLGICVLFLVALGWVLIKTLPTMIEQLTMLLNLGSVREGERLVFNGIPWKVAKLHFYTHLVNPELSGGSLHLPIRQLVGLVSRPPAGNEEWFPSNEGDWVKMDEGTIGEVVYQSPEMVQVRLFGGNLITYTTENYMAHSPMNLSHGYRIQMVFGIDYKYQADCTTTIPRIMTENFRKDLIEAVGEDNLVRVIVDFFLPNNSSLDFEYEVFLKGSAANLYEEVERTIIYSFANTCNENGWEIPFQQITLHQEKPS